MMNKKQLGNSSVVFVCFILFFAMVVKGAFNVLPIYIENQTVKGVIESFIADQDGDLIARQELMDAIDKRLIINGVTSINSQDFKIKSQGGKRFLVADYRSQVPYMLNIDLVVNFDNIRFDVTEITVL